MAAIDYRPCDECRGSGRVALLTSVGVCRRCGGSGFLYAVYDPCRRAWIARGVDGIERAEPELADGGEDRDPRA